MSKRLTKISLTILTLVCAFCMSIAMIGVAKADTTLYQAENFKMETAVQIRQNGTNGIRFWASMSADDYDNLKDVEGIEFGIMIAPTDWLDSADDLVFGNDALPEWYDDTDATKYFAKGVNVPILDVDDFDQDDDVTEYLLHASFVNIKDSNFSRTFTAKAYYKVGNEVVYAQGANEKNIFETASKYVATTEFDEEEPEEKFVKDYVYGIVDKVAEAYTDITVNVAGVQDGVAYRDDEFEVPATLKKPGDDTKVLNAVAKLTIEGEMLEEGVAYDTTTKKYAFKDSGLFTLTTAIGTKYVQTQDITIKRHGVQLNATPTVQLYNFADNSYTSGVGKSYNIRSHSTWTDDENSNAPSDTVYSIKEKEQGNHWLVFNGSYPSNIYLKNGATATPDMGDETVVISYTDAYGVTYSYEHVIENTKFVAKGASNSYIATDAIEVPLTAVSSLNISNVPLTDGTTDFIRFAVNKNVTNNCKVIKMRVSDVNDDTNYVDFFMTRINGTYNWGPATTTFGMQAKGWSTRYGYNTSGVLAKQLLDNSNGSGGLSIAGCPCALVGKYQNVQLMEDTYYREMLGISLVNSEMLLRFSQSANVDPTQWNLCPKEVQDATVSSIWAESEVWSAFDNVTHVNITFYDPQGGVELLIDTIGGEKVTAETLSKFSLTFEKV